MRSTLLFLLLALFCLPVSAQTTSENPVSSEDYRVYTSDGQLATIDDIVLSMKDVDVVFVGESHNDPISHYIEEVLLERAILTYGPEGDSTRQVLLSLEMFQRDTQQIVDEYLAGLITEKQFLAAARPWNNYKTDYRPLIELAKTYHFPVVAANAPRRYVNRVTRLGRDALNDLSDWARNWVAPFPYGLPSPEYTEQWNAVMAESMAAMMPKKDKKDDGNENSESSEGDETPPDTTTVKAPSIHGGALHMLDAQALWDATMSYSIAQALMTHQNALVLHNVGSFHVEYYTGTPEQLQRYRPTTRTLVVVIKPTEDVTSFNQEEHAGLGDFVVLGNEALPRTFGDSK